MKKVKVTVNGTVYEVEIESIESGGKSKPAETPTTEGGLPSPLAGSVVSIQVQVGQSINEGDLLITLEAMKMNTQIRAEESRKVGRICVSVGQTVQEGQILIEWA